MTSQLGWVRNEMRPARANWPRALNSTPESRSQDSRFKTKIPYISKRALVLLANDKNPAASGDALRLEEYRKQHPNWEIVLDLDAFGKEEHENWVWHGSNFLF